MSRLLKNPNLIQNSAFINGSFIKSISGLSFPVLNPATKQVITEVFEPDENDIDFAVRNAYETFHSSSWKSIGPFQRFEMLKKLHSLILENIKDLSTILTLENGKPLAEARGEILYAASFIEWFSEEIKRQSGEILASPEPSKSLSFTRYPVGVCAIITPFNLPAAMITRKLGAALAAGCTAVIKPSPDTPLTCLALTQLIQEAGFPAGCVNVLPSIRHTEFIGNLFCNTPLISKVSFTGSTHIGKLLNSIASSNIKRVSLELGGNAPVLIFDDVDVRSTVEKLLAGKFRCSGQTCVSPNRIFVHENLLEQFLTEAKSQIQSLIPFVNDGLLKETKIGPLINEKALQKVMAHVNDALKNGAQLIVGGRDTKEYGFYYLPTLLSNVTDDMLCFREETFGPVLAVSSFKSESEAIKRANSSEHGLAGYLFTKDSSRIQRIKESVEVGMLGINTCAISYAHAPFGGIKMSGFGREGHRLGLEEYQQVKYFAE